MPGRYEYPLIFKISADRLRANLKYRGDYCHDFMNLRINKKGFTLIELMVTIGIIVFMSAFILANFRRAGDKTELRAVAQKLMSDIKLVQNNALGLKKFNGGLPEGWGIFFDSNDGNNNKYTLFADTHNFQEYDLDEKYLEIQMPSNIIISDNFSGLDSAGNPFSNFRYLGIIMEPPDPVVHVNAGHNTHLSHSVDSRETTITLQNRRGDTIDIKINKFGLVDIEN